MTADGIRPPEPRPEFTELSGLLRNAYDFARGAHHGPARRGETDIEHPVAVAELLCDAGYADEVVAAALLHDVLEDTSHASEEIAARFPPAVSALVEVMTEDGSISGYAERKAEHRNRVLRGGRTPAAVYLADKLARVRRYRETAEPVDDHRLTHYRQTLQQFGAHDPTLPFLDELERELPELEPA